MFLKRPIKGAKVSKNEQFFSKYAKSWILSRGKRATVNYFLYECKNITVEKSKN